MRVFGASEDEMAKSKRAIEKKTGDSASSLVADFTARLSRAGTDKSSFEQALASLRADTSLSARDVIDIAHAYGGGGRKPASKAAALAAISKRYVELVRLHAKNKVAEKARPF